MKRASEDDIARAVAQHAKVVAVVGMKGEQAASEPAFTVPRTMKARGIRVIPVNPTIQESLGEPAIASLAGLTEKVDVVQIFRRAEAVPAIADEILALPAALRPTVVWMQSGIRSDVAAARLEAAGIDVVMDRCLAVELAKHRR